MSFAAASLDLKRAFDSIRYSFIFEALRTYDVGEEYIQLLQMLYRNQKGYVKESAYFDIERGVKQGDVLSTLIFNSALQLIFDRWTSRLDRHGWELQIQIPRLTNLRFADDILLVAKSETELSEMMLVKCKEK